MGNRLIFLYWLIIITSWGKTGHDKLSVLMIQRPKSKSVLVGKSAKTTVSFDGKFPARETI